MGKKLVLVSGGLDSVTLLHRTVHLHGASNVVAVSIFYGQKHAKEMEYAQWHCKKLGVPLYEADLSQVFKFNPHVSALLADSDTAIVHKSYAEQLADLGGRGTVSAYVPYRNGLFLSYAAAVALQFGCDEVLYGAHADDAAGRAYPDCTENFIMAQADAIMEGTAEKVELTAPWWRLVKAEIVTAGLHHGMTIEDFEHTWSCYEGKNEPCGTCGTCIDRQAAFKANGLEVK